jgi:hypothetical protein
VNIAFDWRGDSVGRPDDYIIENVISPDRIRLIEIDVEGLEVSVASAPQLSKWNGLETVGSSARLPRELHKPGATFDGFDQHMKRFGYRSYIVPMENEPWI